MNIRDAILATAALFESKPSVYNFQSNDAPSCDSPGCMMGWIGHFLGVPVKKYGVYLVDVADVAGFSYGCIGDVVRAEISRRMPIHGYDAHSRFLHTYQVDAMAAASALRLFADARFPVAPLRFPDWNAMASTRTVGADEPADAVRS